MGANDWDLQAVVRGRCFADQPSATTIVEDSFSSLSPTFIKKELMDGEDGLFDSFPDLTVKRTDIHELEELLKPFFPKLQQPPLLTPQQSSSSSSRLTAASQIPAVHQLQQPRKSQRPLSQTPCLKRRKNQQKKVVCQVPADETSSDMWAWRKYGQKPIKGSPFPRGYYRCSSSKGCMARKQVERSRTDPGMLVITYTAEHNHPAPTNRNSLAGSSRQSFPPPPTNASAATGGEGKQSLQRSNSPSSSPLSSSTAAGLSPRTPLTASMEEVEGEEDVLVGIDMVYDDKLPFTSLEGLGRPTAVAAAAVAAPMEAVSVTSTVLNDDDGFAEHLFPCPWLTEKNAPAASCS